MMFKIAILLTAFVGSTATYDPDPPDGPPQETCAFLPACNPCHWPGKPPLPPGFGWFKHGTEIGPCP